VRQVTGVTPLTGTVQLVTIHWSDPFATPDDLRSPVRRLRGRLPSPVTLWTANGPAGLTVSSTVVVDGDPGRVLGLVDEESALWEAASATGRFVVLPLVKDDQQLADRFAGLLPAPGGLFADAEWTPTEWGPVLVGRATWAECRVDAARPFGWSMLVEATIEHVELGLDEPPLLHYRGRYHAFGTPSGK
jgi:3-hydroxy-9,10-secoandrosta-1,3,5(10)-triene-9,17-dione monooxygenase reductase component